MPNFKAYIIGFVSSILLTLAAFVLVYVHVRSSHEVFAHSDLIIYILILALVQLAVQAVLFLHLGRESKPRLNLVTLITTMALVLILVTASLWIMSHLDSYHMNPQEMQNYLQNSESF